MHHIDQEYPAQSVIRYNCHKVIDRCDKWSRSNRRVYMNLLKEQRNQCSNRSDTPIHPDTAYANTNVFPLNNAI